MKIDQILVTKLWDEHITFENINVINIKSYVLKKEKVYRKLEKKQITVS